MARTWRTSARVSYAGLRSYLSLEMPECFVKSREAKRWQPRLWRKLLRLLASGGSMGHNTQALGFQNPGAGGRRGILRPRALFCNSSTPFSASREAPEATDRQRRDFVKSDQPRGPASSSHSMARAPASSYPESWVSSL